MAIKPFAPAALEVLEHLSRVPIRAGNCTAVRRSCLRTLVKRGYAEATTGEGPDQLFEITDAGRKAWEELRP